MRQVACPGSLPPRWVTKASPACAAIPARRAGHASPKQKQKRSRAAAARLPCPCPCASPRLALQHAHTRAIAPLAFATAKQPSTQFRSRSQKVPARTANRLDHRRWRFMKGCQEQCLI